MRLLSAYENTWAAAVSAQIMSLNGEPAVNDATGTVKWPVESVNVVAIFVFELFRISTVA